MATLDNPVSGQHSAIAVVDDDPSARMLMRRALEDQGFEVMELVGGRDLLAVPAAKLAVVCLDLGLGDVNGLDLIQALRLSEPDLPIVVVTVMGEVETAVAAMRLGAYDYLVKPIDRVRLIDAVRRAAERRWLLLGVERARAGVDVSISPAIVGRSAAMHELAVKIERVLDSDVAVVLSGESGTGKELVARAIHERGRRAARPFVAVNCAAIPESLHESELFGHERGAFTGAVAVHRGRFEEAEGGTLFLDEVAEMSPATQASLLRALQERRIRRVGGTEDVPVDVRIICATNRDLAEQVRAGRFREDLYYRLAVYPIRVPPLRERMEDLPVLVAHFLAKHQGDVGRPTQRISSEVIDMLSHHSWPGNVRELENVIHHAMLACPGGELLLAHLSEDFRRAQMVSPLLTGGGEHPRCEQCSPDEVIPLRELERREIKKALRVAGGSVGKAAKLLGMGRATLYRRLAEESGLLS